MSVEAARIEGEAGDASRILIVDDDRVLARALQRLLQRHGFAVDLAFDGASAIERVRQGSYDVMLLDLRMDSMGGIEVFQNVRDDPEAPATILHSGHLDVPTAVVATRSGVSEVLEKPVPEQVLLARIRDAIEVRRARAARAEGERAADPFGHLVGDSTPMKKLRESIQRAARFRELSVLVVGAPGTGKEAVAEAIHRASSPDEPFVNAACGTVPELPFEMELFGYERDPDRGSRAGLLEEALNGTIFLDDIGDMPLKLQERLFAVLEAKQVSPARPFGARVIAATSRPLSPDAGGGMHAGLYARLGGLTITTPALAERISDLPQLARYFLEEFARRHRMHPLELFSEAVAELGFHSWPGNLRELRAVMEHAAVLAPRGKVGTAEIRAAIAARGSRAAEEQRPPASNPLGETVGGEYLSATVREGEGGAMRPSLPDLQREFILRAFAGSGHNLSRAARELGIPRSTLRDRLRRYGAR